jgi:hypothetical protein
MAASKGLPTQHTKDCSRKEGGHGERLLVSCIISNIGQEEMDKNVLYLSMERRGTFQLEKLDVGRGSCTLYPERRSCADLDLSISFDINARAFSRRDDGIHPPSSH